MFTLNISLPLIFTFHSSIRYAVYAPQIGFKVVIGANPAYNQCDQIWQFIGLWATF